MAFFIVAQYVVEMPVAVERGICVMEYFPPKFSSFIKHDKVIYLWAGRSAEVYIYYRRQSTKWPAGCRKAPC